MKRCFREPIQALADSARYMDAAVSAHLAGHVKVAEELFTLANLPEVRDWLESVWGKGSPYVVVNKLPPSMSGRRCLLECPMQDR